MTSTVLIGGLKFRRKDECGNGRDSDGYILPDTPWGKEFGFTSDKFEGYLWKQGHWIIISQIKSLDPGRGNFKRLVRSIKDFVFDVAVPTPLAQMEAVLTKWGWQQHWVALGFNKGDPRFMSIELWTEPGKKTLPNMNP